MTRKPNNDLQWWRDALEGLKPQITDQPMPGWYRRRLVKHGPFVGVQIWNDAPHDESGDLLDDEILKCTVDNRDADPVDNWLYCCVHPISVKEFEYLSKLSKFAKKHAKREPLANPRKPINVLAFPLPEFPQAKRKKS